jgi:hypothetical protein
LFEVDTATATESLRWFFLRRLYELRPLRVLLILPLFTTGAVQAQDKPYILEKIRDRGLIQPAAR